MSTVVRLVPPEKGRSVTPTWSNRPASFACSLCRVVQNGATMKTRTTPAPIRLTISVDPTTHAVYQRLADSVGRGLGSSIGEWLKDTSEAAAKMAETIEHVRNGPKRVTAELVHDSSPHQAAVDVLAKAKRSSEALACDAPQKSAGRVGAAKTPRLVIRGGKSTEMGTVSGLRKGSMPPAKVQAYADTNGIPPRGSKP
jgi:hypothetical protein